MNCGEIPAIVFASVEAAVLRAVLSVQGSASLEQPNQENKEHARLSEVLRLTLSLTTMYVENSYTYGIRLAWPK